MTNAILTTSSCFNEGLTTRSPVAAVVLSALRTRERCLAVACHSRDVDASGSDSAWAASAASGAMLTARLNQIMFLPKTASANRLFCAV
jgi:hypothetical protein